jgi:hypothetical protein
VIVTTLRDIGPWLREIAAWLRDNPFGADVSRQAAECVEAAETVEKFSGDTERLNWLQSNDALLNYAAGHKPHVCVHKPNGDNIHFYGMTFRDAIDNAMFERKS